MKKSLTWLLGIMICASIAQAADVKVKTVLTTAKGSAPTTTFAADTPLIHGLFQTTGAKEGDKLRAVWIAEDIGKAAPANTKISEKTLTLEGDTKDGDFSVSKPTKGWPAGQYRLEIYANDKLVTTDKFNIAGPDKSEKSSEKHADKDSDKDSDKHVTSSAKSDDDSDHMSEESDEPEFSFKVHNTTKEKIVKLLASEDGQEYGSFDVGKSGIAPGETITLIWDKSTNNTDCQWLIKAVYEDGEESDPGKFNFCEDDVELEF